MQKKFLFLSLLLLTIVADLRAQQSVGKTNKDPYAQLVGQYQVKFFPSQKFNVFTDNNRLLVEIAGQGRGELLSVSENRFKVKGVKPEAFVEFKKDNYDSVTTLTWIQKSPVQTWIRTEDTNSDNSSGAATVALSAYTGKFTIKGNPYLKIIMEEKNNHLVCTLTNRDPFDLKQLASNKFVFGSDGYTCIYEFIAGENGHFNKLTAVQEGPVICVRNLVNPVENVSSKHSFYKRPGFTRGDTLLGMLSSLRSCYDVLFYHLDVAIEPDTKSVVGNNMIRFKSMKDFDKLQVDLYYNMKIEKILYHDKELEYTRESDAVFIQFPVTISTGTIDEFTIYYNGVPQLLDLLKGTSGFLWEKDKNGKLWIESVSQGSGASTWWPCKDHLTDKPDSMEISVTVPQALNDVSNGRFLGKTVLPNGQTRYDWYVSYPINAYDVVLYVGDYFHYTGQHINGIDTLLVNYYCLAYNEKFAREFYTRVDPMLTVFENAFGPYPFKKDGFAMVEGPYGMEHQSAVSMGPIFEPSRGDQYDSANLINSLWHETSHEWWGNSVTCKDYADFWIHESFATYSEILARGKLWGKDAENKYIGEQKGENKETIIGYYDVNDFHMGDMYPKGGRMLITLKNIINNDSLWFSILRGLQQKFRYQSITTEDVIHYFNEITKTDYTYLFDQYLRHPALPVLMLQIIKEGSALTIQYKWKADVSDFHMPVKVTISKNSFDFIYPSAEWKTITIQNMGEKEFKVDTLDFYIDVSKN